MKKDIQNVLATFGLIGLTLYGGYFINQNQVQAAYDLAVAQEAELQRMAAVEAAKAEQEFLLEQARQAELETQRVAEQTAAEQAAAQKTLAQKEAADRARRQAALVAEQQAQARAAAAQVSTPAPKAQAPAPVKPSRRSRAS